MTTATKYHIDRAIRQQEDRRRQAVMQLNMTDEKLVASYAETVARFGAFFEPGFWTADAIRARAQEDASRPIDYEKARYDAELHQEGIDDSNSDI